MRGQAAAQPCAGVSAGARAGVCGWAPVGERASPSWVGASSTVRDAVSDSEETCRPWPGEVPEACFGSLARELVGNAPPFGIPRISWMPGVSKRRGHSIHREGYFPQPLLPQNPGKSMYFLPVEPRVGVFFTG
jgi:hypothetical protein